MDILSKQPTAYYRRIELGVCVACGLQPPIPGKRRCELCRVKRTKVSQTQKDNRPPGTCRQCLTRPVLPNKQSCDKCAHRGASKSRENYRKIRQMVLGLYGSCCACCGEKNSKYLQLDHVNNDGNIERRSLPSSVRGGRFYKLVLNQGKRNDLQLLCANCHNAKRYGGCTSEDHPLLFLGTCVSS
jgi:hypothetical protein